MSELKRKWDVLKGSDSESDDCNNMIRSPNSDVSNESSKRRKEDLECRIFELGFEGSKEQLEELSRSQKKKLFKKLLWIKKKPLKRKAEKEKKKVKILEQKLSGIMILSRKAKKSNSLINSNCKLSVVIDLSFDDFMSEKDLNKCVNQINRCYCVNRSVKDPMQFYITHLNGKSKEVFSKLSGYKNWDVRLYEQSYIDIFSKDRLVYLTSDSDNVIDELDENKVYIIGGLVDHNAHKNLCYRIACDQGIAHGRLPIDKYVDMSSRKVLAINHVFEIMLHVVGGMSWKNAFLTVLPQRKNAQPKLDDLPLKTCNDENTTGVMDINEDSLLVSEELSADHKCSEDLKGNVINDTSTFVSVDISDSQEIEDVKCLL